MNLIYAVLLAITSSAPPTYPLKINVVSGLTATGQKSGVPCSAPIWKGTFGTQASLTATGGTPPYVWKFPDGTSKSGAQVTWKIVKSGCLGVRDGSDLWQKIYVQGIPPGPPTSGTTAK